MVDPQIVRVLDVEEASPRGYARGRGAVALLEYDPLLGLIQDVPYARVCRHALRPVADLSLLQCIYVIERVGHYQDDPVERVGYFEIVMNCLPRALLVLQQEQVLALRLGNKLPGLIDYEFGESDVRSGDHVTGDNL